MNTNDGGPIHPCEITVWYDLENGVIDSRLQKMPGMSLRDWFAGQALAGLMTWRSPLDAPSDRARAAYRTADAMLAEREKGA